ncbi:hypothetical protein Agabi119p4_7195 [Agaricus bisporus var. burnettii]|uniref:Uncharacterized protein n=1 Tax=Agaricus bisporus var. burnettii TaxID=192524 RepID=A0A8H7C6K5_AGABI|nr:hypothetical protein Agabi119p4_7195 [Agaricus bisporus var. burnettii]
MDADRKSTVSSFYGGRKSSDALNQDYPAPNPATSRLGRDDASSFFNPDPQRMSLTGRGVTAGYNPSSFYPGREEPIKGGRDEEEEAWDVYADFNNTGPRYSSAFMQSPPTNAKGYQPLNTPTQSSKELEAGSATPVEMVTVPALGAEWGKAELHGMTKTAKREKVRESRKEKWKQWNRGQRGMCGSFCTRKVFAWSLFGLCAAIVLVLALCLPRVPSFSFNSRTPLVNATGAWAEAVSYGFSRTPANFSFPAFASLQLNTGNNFVPVTFKHMRASIYDLDTGDQVGTGDLLESRTVPPKSFPQISLPLNFTYSAINASDIAWNNWYNGCRNRINSSGNRPAVKFRLSIELDILGLIGTRTVSTQIADASCPWELPVDSV